MSNAYFIAQEDIRKGDVVTIAENGGVRLARAHEDRASVHKDQAAADAHFLRVDVDKRFVGLERELVGALDYIRQLELRLKKLEDLVEAMRSPLPGHYPACLGKDCTQCALHSFTRKGRSGPRFYPDCTSGCFEHCLDFCICRPGTT